MCIIFLGPECSAHYADSHLKLVASLERKLEIGLCVDPTSYSAVHCKKLQVRHKGIWYDKCDWCTDLATQWREGKVNQYAEMDRVEAEKLEMRKTLERETEKREEEIMKKGQRESSNENQGSHFWTRTPRALST
jgi:tRNA U54 and U55 pseudouridine synthase Pus10